MTFSAAFGKVFVRRIARSQRRRPRGLRRVGLAPQTRPFSSPTVLRRAMRARRRLRHGLKRAFPMTRGAASAAPIRLRRLRPRRKVTLRLKPPKLPQGFTTPRQGMVIRMLKAVSRMRRKMQERLRRRPHPEELETPSVVIVRVEGSMKGRVFSPGLVRARVKEGLDV